MITNVFAYTKKPANIQYFCLWNRLRKNVLDNICSGEIRCFICLVFIQCMHTMFSLLAMDCNGLTETIESISCCDKGKAVVRVNR